jgi:hypothetical protein
MALFPVETDVTKRENAPPLAFCVDQRFPLRIGIIQNVPLSNARTRTEKQHARFFLFPIQINVANGFFPRFSPIH